MPRASMELPPPQELERMLRAWHLVMEGGNVRRLEDGSYLVESQRYRGHYYRARAGWCQCPDHTYRRMTCKHMYAVRLAEHLAHHQVTSPDVMLASA